MLAQHMKDKHGHEPPSRAGAVSVTLNDLLQASRHNTIPFLPPD